MKQHIDEHLLVDAKYIASPNHSERPQDADISLLVIHNISLPPGEFGTDFVAQLFCNTLDCAAHPYFEDLVDLKVSSHLFIDRAGSLIQFVPFNRKAWHAGQSVFEGRENCNEFSIGIELEGTDDEPFTNAQYECLESATLSLLERYPAITLRRIVGHSDIAPGRKTDPGPHFDWERYLGALKA